MAAAELILYNVGLKIKYAAQKNFGLFANLVGKEFKIYYNANFWIIIPILITLIYMRIICPDALSRFTEGSLCTTVMVTLLILITLYLHKRREAHVSA